jgi:hypothetical protein
MDDRRGLRCEVRPSWAKVKGVTFLGERSRIPAEKVSQCRTAQATGDGLEESSAIQG